MNVLRHLWNTAEQVVAVTDVIQKQLRIIAGDMIRGTREGDEDMPVQAEEPWANNYGLRDLLPGVELVSLTPINTKFSIVSEGPRLEVTPIAEQTPSGVITLQG
jgi:hypothetical protein